MNWTVADARALRRKDTTRRARQHDRFGRHVQGLMRAGYSAAGAILGPRVYGPALLQASARMNANRFTAYEGHALTGKDIVCSAYFKAGTNWIMHVTYQIANLGEGAFSHIQDAIAWPDAAQDGHWSNALRVWLR